MYRFVVLFVLVLSVVGGGYFPLGVQFDFVEKEYVVRYSDPLRVLVYLEDSGSPVEGVLVDVYVFVGGSKSLLGSNRTSSEGVAVIFVSSVLFVPGSYEILASCSYGGSEYNATSTLVVLREKTELRVGFDEFSVEYSDLANFSCYLITDDGEAIPNALVRVYIGDNSLVGMTNARGIAIFLVDTKNISLSVGIYSVRLYYDGDNYYLPSNTSFDMSVVPEEITISVSAIGKKYTGSSIEILVVVVDNDGSVVPFVSVEILLDGELLCMGLTDEFGRYNYTWRPTKPGNYVLLVVVWGENYLNATHEFILEISGQTYGSLTDYVFLGILFLVVIITSAVVIKKTKYGTDDL